MQCATCGFRDDSVSPSDAAVALRSYPRRFRAVLVRLDDEDGADVIRRPASDGWSALDHAAHAAESIRVAGDALRLVSISESPLVSYAPERRVEAAGPLDEVLHRLEVFTEVAAEQVDRVKGRDWERIGRLHEVGGGGDTEVSALDIARHAVHEGVHHLRGAQTAVEQAVSQR